jgi:hypothetical protein
MPGVRTIPAGTQLYRHRPGTLEMEKTRVTRVAFRVETADRHAFGLPDGWVVWHCWGRPLFAQLPPGVT